MPTPSRAFSSSPEPSAAVSCTSGRAPEPLHVVQPPRRVGPEARDRDHVLLGARPDVREHAAVRGDEVAAREMLGRAERHDVSRCRRQQHEVIAARHPLRRRACARAGPARPRRSCRARSRSPARTRARRARDPGGATRASARTPRATARSRRDRDRDRRRAAPVCDRPIGSREASRDSVRAVDGGCCGRARAPADRCFPTPAARRCQRDDEHTRRPPAAVPTAHAGAR